MKQIKCLAISNSYPPDHAGGYELGAFNLLEALASECGWSNTVFSSVRKKKSSWTADPVLTGFFPGKLGPELELIKTKRSLLNDNGAIVTALKQAVMETDIVFIFNPRRLVLPQWTSVFALGKPVCMLVSDFWPQDPYGSDVFYSRMKKQNGALRDHRLRELYHTVPPLDDFFADVSGVIFGSRFMKNSHSDSLAKIKNQSVGHWGIDTAKFLSVPFSEKRLKTLGFCGRPEPEKGLNMALDAFRDLSMQYPELELRIASDLKGSSFGRSMIKRIHYDPILKERVTLLGHVPHEKLHAELYSKIGVLLFPSVWEEPFAITVLEAMATGAIVVGSDTGGTPEVVDDETGYLFDPKKAGSLVDACFRAIVPSEVNRAKSIAGIARIMKRHTIDSMAMKVDEFIRKLL